MNHPVRKKIRLEKYDYSSIGAYFITVCVNNHNNIFWDSDYKIKYPNELSLPLSEYGMIVYEALQKIESHYPSVFLDKYVIMPNHLHLILIIGADDNATVKSRDVSLIVNQFKGYVTKKIGKAIWQKSYNDHIIRGEYDYKEICEYIENNPANWEERHF